MIVYNALIQTIRSEQQKGYYLFNRVDNVAFTPDDSLAFVAIPDKTIRVEAIANDTMSPSFRYVRGLPLQQDQLVPTSVSGTFPPGSTIRADVVYLKQLDECAQEFLDYCAVKTAHKLAGVFNPTFDASLVRSAYDNLVKAEVVATPRSNVFNDNYESVHTWYRVGYRP